MTSKRKLLIFLVPAVLLTAVLLYAYIPCSERSQLAAVCRVRAQVCYTVRLAKGDTLFLSLRGDSLQTAAVAADSVAGVREQSAAFVSNEGDFITSDALVGGCPDSLTDGLLRKRLELLDALQAQRLRQLRAEREELDDYARTHSVVDDGYNEVMAYRESVGQRVAHAETVAERLSRALEERNLAARLYVRAEVVGFYGGERQTLPAHVRRRVGGLMLLRLDTLCLPQGAGRFSVYRWGVRKGGSRLMAYNDLGGASAAFVPSVCTDSTWLMPAAEGGVWVNGSGHISGVERNGRRVPADSVATLLRGEHCWPVWWYRNFISWCKSLSSDGNGDSPEPPVVAGCRKMEVPDSLVYEGQMTESAVGGDWIRQGMGKMTMADGTVFFGEWRADSLVRGERCDSSGRYVGTFNRAAEPDGYGVYRSNDGERYSGQWRDGKRWGHGFSLKAGEMVRCGHWRKGRFHGERMVYTAERIYGIDISRYQHGKGKKKYKIDWANLRITGLGGDRRVSGRVDYPVSYIYIKSTEGRSVYNKFYADDIRQARRHGIPAGTYHFFSPNSTGAEQAAYFLKMSVIAAEDLPPVLDLEPTESQIAQMGGEAKMFREVLVWLRTVEKRCGKKPLIYVGQNFVNNHLNHAPAELKGYDVWIARYGEYKPYVRLLHWQLSPHGTVRGIRGDVDINVFNGTKEAFKQWIGG